MIHDKVAYMGTGKRSKAIARGASRAEVRLRAFEKLLAKAAPAVEHASQDRQGDSEFAEWVLATPDGPVVFEHPVWQAVWDLATDPTFYVTASEGEKLDNNILHWVPLLTKLVRGKLARAGEVLALRVPTSDVVLPLPARLAIFGDGGNRGLAQRTVLDMIAARHRTHPFHVIIHLGDTYHGGSEAEMLRNLVAPLLAHQARLAGKPAVFSLCGNHDLYAGPDGYLAVLDALAQPGRYFALEAGPYRIACLDSALGDGGLRLSGKLDGQQLEWLAAKQLDRKQLIVLTHHVPRSAWERPSIELRDQVAGLTGLLAWYWGHEHRAVAFEHEQFYGGCVGNGAFLQRRTKCPDARGVVWYPRRSSCTCFDTRGSKYWPHGFLELELDIDGVQERWHVENDDVFERRLPGRG